MAKIIPCSWLYDVQKKFNKKTPDIPPTDVPALIFFFFLPPPCFSVWHFSQRFCNSHSSDSSGLLTEMVLIIMLYWSLRHDSLLWGDWLSCDWLVPVGPDPATHLLSWGKKRHLSDARLLQGPDLERQDRQPFYSIVLSVASLLMSWINKPALVFPVFESCFDPARLLASIGCSCMQVNVSANLHLEAVSCLPRL